MFKFLTNAIVLLEKKVTQFYHKTNEVSFPPDGPVVVVISAGFIIIS